MMWMTLMIFTMIMFMMMLIMMIMMRRMLILIMEIVMRMMLIMMMMMMLMVLWKSNMSKNDKMNLAKFKLMCGVAFSYVVTGKSAAKQCKDK